MAESLNDRPSRQLRGGKQFVDLSSSGKFSLEDGFRLHEFSPHSPKPLRSHTRIDKSQVSATDSLAALCPLRSRAISSPEEKSRSLLRNSSKDGFRLHEFSPHSPPLRSHTRIDKSQSPLILWRRFAHYVAVNIFT